MPATESPLVAGRRYRFTSPPPRLLFLRGATRKSQRKIEQEPKPKKPQSKSDEWLAGRLEAAERAAGAHRSASPSQDFRCTLEIQARELSITPGGPFEDPILFTLTLSAHAPEGGDGFETLPSSPRVVIDEYCGAAEDPIAPLWTSRRKPKCAVTEKGAVLASMFMRLAAHRANLEQPGVSLEMIEWAQVVSTGTRASSSIQRKAMALGFPRPIAS